MARLARVWYMKDTEVVVAPTSSSFVCKDQRCQEEEIYSSMIKITSHLELLTKHLLGTYIEKVNIIDANDTNSNEDEE